MEFLGWTNLILITLISLIIWFLVGLKWNKWSDFFHTRYSYIDLSFIVIYFIEQLALSYFIYERYDAQIIAGIFSIIIITTAAVQNKCWESRTDRISQKSIEQNNIILSLSKQNKLVINDNKNLITKLEESSNLTDEIFKELEKSEKIINKLKKQR